MRIVVLGAGTVGTSISSLLCLHRHSVTVVDTRASEVRSINEALDVRAIIGSASQSSVLFQAGIMDADLCLAATRATIDCTWATRSSSWCTMRSTTRRSGFLAGQDIDLVVDGFRRGR